MIRTYVMKHAIPTNIKGRVGRILLNDPSGTLTKYRVAKLAGGGYPWIHRLLKALEEQGIISKTRVTDLKLLMEWWQRWQPAPKYREYMIQRPLDVIRGAGLDYALTTYQAENRIQSYLFPSRTDIHVRPKDGNRWHKLLVRDGLVGRGNVRVLTGDEHVFYGSMVIDGLTLVSVPQLILDLYNEGGSCVEAGDMLLEGMRGIAL